MLFIKHAEILFIKHSEIFLIKFIQMNFDKLLSKSIGISLQVSFKSSDKAMNSKPKNIMGAIKVLKLLGVFKRK